MSIEEQGVSVGTLVREIVKKINEYHRAAVDPLPDPEKRLLNAYHKAVLSVILMVKEEYEP